MTSAFGGATSSAADTLAPTVSHGVVQTTQRVSERVVLPALVGRTTNLVRTAARFVTAKATAEPHPHVLATPGGRKLRVVEPTGNSVRAPRSPSVAPRTIFGAAPVGADTPAGSGAAGVGLLLFGLLAFAALTVPPDVFRRRTLPRGRVLRPLSPLLRLERPD